MKSKLELQFDFLKEEYNNLQLNIRNYDNLLFIIKGWAITIYVGFIYFSIRESRFELIILSILLPLLFWVVDSIFKSFQARFILRSQLIEDYLKSAKFDKDIRREEIKGIPIPDMFAREIIGLGKEQKALTLKIHCAFYLHQIILYISMILCSFFISIIYFA